MRLVKPYQVSSQTGPPKAAFGTMPFVLALFSHHWLPPFGFTGHNSPATRHSPLPPTTLPRWLLPDTDRRIAKTERGPIWTSGPSISLCAEPGDSCAQIHPFLPTRRCSPVDRSLVAGGAPRQRLEACLPDTHRPR